MSFICRLDPAPRRQANTGLFRMGCPSGDCYETNKFP